MAKHDKDMLDGSKQFRARMAVMNGEWCADELNKDYGNPHSVFMYFRWTCKWNQMANRGLVQQPVNPWEA